VVLLVEAEQIAAVNRENGAISGLQIAHRQLHEEDRIDEGIDHRPHAAVHHMADKEFGQGCHDRLRHSPVRGPAPSSPCHGA
jgi:hypothetical protein